MRAKLNAKKQISHFRTRGIRRITLRTELLERRCLLAAEALYSLGSTALMGSEVEATPSSRQEYTADLASSSLRHYDGPFAGESPAVKGLVTKPSTVDLGDYYWADGRQVPLQRKSDQFVVGFTAPHLSDTLSAERIAEVDRIQFDGWTKVSDIVPGISIWEASSLTASVFDSDVSDAMLSVFDREEVQWSSPVFIEPLSGLQQVVSNEVIVALDKDTDPALFFATDTFSTYRPLLGTPDQFVATLAGSGGADTLRLTSELDQLPGVAFASPNFLTEIQFQSVPNDPLFNMQWHLQNTGQFGGKVGADAKLTTAWDITTGSQEVVIAIFDNGVQTNHPDLAANIWVNPYEIAGNGLDDDGNGWVDDVHGWNFGASNNDPNPIGSDNHGTPVAGVAAGRGNNGLGVAGAAYNVKIMGITLLGSGSMLTSAAWASAIYYAAGRTADGNGTWRGADIGNHSYGTLLPNTTVTTAFDWAENNGRGGLGMANFAASGNNATGFRPGGSNGALLDPGTWRFVWDYKKDDGYIAGEDTAWLAGVGLPDGTVQRFDSPAWPSGWTTGGDALWSIVDDPARSYGTGRHVAKAGSIGDNQSSWIMSPSVVVTQPSSLLYQLWVSSEANYDGIRHYFSYNGGPWQQVGSLLSGVPQVIPLAFYPANISSTISVGASTQWDYRSAYSQYLLVDFVAPSSTAIPPYTIGTINITSVDRTGSAGMNPPPSGDPDPAELPDLDYTRRFGGTSSASPLAAGIGALLLSKNPNLMAVEVREAMEESADKIGGVTYTSGFNPYYGYGRVNATAALALVDADISGPTVVDSVFVPDPRRFVVEFNERTVWTANSIAVRAPDNSVMSFTEFGSGTNQLAVVLPPLSQNGVYSVILTGVSPATAFKDQAGNRINGGQTDVVLNFTYGSPTPTGDFNGDGLFNIVDIDALVTAIAAGTHNALYDLTGDGLVNLGDRDSWLAIAGAINLGPGRAYKIADANLNGVVDGSDFGVWNANKFTSVALWSKAEFDANGVVDGSDFGMWNADKFTSSDGAMRQWPRQFGVPTCSLSFETERHGLDHRRDVAKDAVMELFCDEKDDLVSATL